MVKSGNPAYLPQNMSEASTHSSMLRDRNRQTNSTWLYYQGPVQTYLRGLGCPDQDIDDLTHEILIRLQTYVLLHYNPSQPFRPYLKTTIRNFYFSHLRSRPPTGAMIQDPACTPVDESTIVPPAADLPDPSETLIAYARQMFDQFASDADEKSRPGVEMLRSWMMSGAKQDQLAAEWKLSDRQVRVHMSRAADGLTEWMQSRLNPEDLAELVALAQRKGLNIALDVGTIRGLFNHLSKQKRMQVLLVLSLIHKQQQLAPAT
jgi:DNA-directed RNA polymerase specialized sigma24 family protein